MERASQNWVHQGLQMLARFFLNKENENWINLNRINRRQLEFKLISGDKKAAV
jgi:hypothetical protein